jgi:hypothetical protein
MASQQGAGLHAYCDLGDALRVEQTRPEPKKQPIPRGKLGGAFTGTVQDEHLMLEHQRLSGDRTNTAWSHQLCQRGQQMRHQYE